MKPVLVVTGSSRGIGAAIARAAAGQRYAVCVTFHQQANAAEALVAGIRSGGGQAFAYQADVGREADVSSLFNAVDRELGPVTALVNNAGITGGIGRVENVSAAQIAETFATNVTGSFLCAREAIRRMSTRHGGPGGAIVNISSGASRTGSPGRYVHYAASKGAIDTMTLGLAREVAEDGIRVNAVRAGITDTTIHGCSNGSEAHAQLSALPPMKRMAMPQEIARAALWLLSDEASYVTGALVDVAGGL